jgi:hypothetical protein
LTQKEKRDPGMTVALRRIVAVASRSTGHPLRRSETDAAKRFYPRGATFIEQPQDCRILFLPIETVFAARLKSAQLVEVGD